MRGVSGLVGDRRRARLPRVALAVACALLAPACGVGARVAAVPEQASRELALARRALEQEDRAGALAAAERALAQAPDWVAPARLIDDVARASLRDGELLERRLRELAAAPGEARSLYLLGRLEGLAGRERFERAASIAPGLAWPHHGLAWMRFARGEVQAALGHGRRALALARDPWERAFFSEALARYLAASGDEERALEVLHAVRLAELEPHDRLAFAARLAAFEVATEEEEEVRRGFARALALLEQPELADASAAALARVVLVAGDGLGAELVTRSLESALGRRDGPRAAELRAELAAGRGALALARSLRERAQAQGQQEAGGGDPAPSPFARRAERLAAGEQPADLLEEWCAALPARLRRTDGLSRDARLRRLVELAPSAEAPPEALERFGQALLEAGWFLEALGYAESIAARLPLVAAELDRRANAGRALMVGIAAALEAVDRGAPQLAPWRGRADEAEGEGRGLEARRIKGLEALLDVLQGLFDRFHGERREDLAASPREDYGLLATLVHPGPGFSASDEREGLGRRGASVPGLALELARLQRFGIFGEALGGGGPDGTVLRLLLAEEVRGRHLGVPFEGTVAWCEATEVPSRPARRGARITGAALHQGYWIDLSGVRREAAAWRRRASDFERRADELRAVLSSRGPRLELVGGSAALARRRVYAAEGEAERVRLSLLAERGAPDFDELLDAVAIHEEGHLCDRTRFLPPWKHAGRVLRLFFSAGLTPEGIARRLEYRAQLTALCVARDPRVPLADCLDAVDVGASATEHAAAYRELVADLVDVLADGLEEGAEFARGLDPGAFVVHQLHLLGPEEVRSAGLRLAERRGMREEE